jgi:hypothetical protein
MSDQPPLTDTTADAERVRLQLLREKTPPERVAIALRHSGEIIRLAKRAIERVNPEFTERQVGRRFIELQYGEELAKGVHESGGSRMDGSIEIVDALRPVLHELNRLGARYYIGGSVASSSHGVGRSTLDVDVVAELDEASVISLFAKLQDKYYISQAAALDAVQRRSSFSLVCLATSFKIDIFVSQDREFDRSVFERASIEILGDAAPLSACVATAEDILLLKLEWYRLGNENLQRQWDDLTQVVKLQGDRLDREYLHRWAEELGVTELLARLLSQLGERE